MCSQDISAVSKLGICCMLLLTLYSLIARTYRPKQDIRVPARPGICKRIQELKRAHKLFHMLTRKQCCLQIGYLLHATVDAVEPDCMDMPAARVSRCLLDAGFKDSCCSAMPRSFKGPHKYPCVVERGAVVSAGLVSAGHEYDYTA